MAWKRVALIVIILLILGVVVAGLLFGGEKGSEVSEEEPTPPVDEGPGDSEEPSEPTLPAILSRLNGSVNDVYVGDGRLYITLYESYPEKNRSMVYLYIFDLDEERFIDKVLVEKGAYADLPNYRILTVEDGRAYLYTKAGKTVLVHIPLVNFISVRAGGTYQFKVVDIESGDVINTFRLKIEPAVAVSSNMIYTYELESSNTFVFRGYNLENGSLEVEFYYTIDVVEYLTGLYLAYSSVDGGVVTALFVGIEANYDLGRLRVFHVTLRYDTFAENLIVEVYPTSVYGAYGSIYATTGYVDGDTYYVFTAYSFTTGNKTVNSYTVESRSFSDGSLLWDYTEEFRFTEKNSSTYITSYVDNGVFYVSWSFLAAYKDGEKLFMVSPWGGIYRVPTIFVVIPAKVYEGGGGFYKVGGELYVSWVQRVEGSGIKGVKLYRVTQEGVELVYDLYQKGYVGTLFISYGSKIYFAGSYSDGSGVIVRLI